MNNSKRISLRTILDKDKLSAKVMKNTVGGFNLHKPEYAYCESGPACTPGYCKTFPFSGRICFRDT